jgi:hypothetical protein
LSTSWISAVAVGGLRACSRDIPITCRVAILTVGTSSGCNLRCCTCRPAFPLSDPFAICRRRVRCSYLDLDLHPPDGEEPG